MRIWRCTRCLDRMVGPGPLEKSCCGCRKLVRFYERPIAAPNGCLLVTSGDEDMSASGCCPECAKRLEIQVQYLLWPFK